jgi:hypothetical protein
MTVVQKKIGILLLLVSLAGAQNTVPAPATVQDVKVMRDGKDVRVDVTLSGPVKPTVITAVHPDRLVLELPNTTSSARQQHIPVNFSGVRAVRYGLNNAKPAITRVVIELDQAQAYALDTNGTHVILNISAAATAEDHRGAPPAAASSGLLGVFRRRQDLPPPVDAGNNIPLPAPPPSGPPIQFPAGQSGSSGNSTTASASTPSAAHPNRGSLQEGTVFPGMGAPGTGSVPGTVGTNTGGFGTATSGASKTTVAGAQSGTAFPGTSTPSTATAVVTAPQTKPQDAATAKPKAAPAAATSVTATATPVAALPVTPAPAVTAPAPQPKTEIVAISQPPAAPPAVNSPPALPQDSSRSAAEKKQGSSTASASQSQPASSGSAGQTVAESVEPAASAQPAPETLELAPVADKPSTPDTSYVDQQLLALRAANPNLRTVFKVKYVADGVAYLDGGRTDGLTEGMKLEIKDSDVAPRAGEVADPADPRVVAELEVNAVADTSSVTDIRTPKRAVKPGDLAYLSTTDALALVQQQALSATRKYPAVVTFTEGDPLDEEARAEVPKPPLPSVNRARGRFGLDYIGTSSAGITTSNLGVVVRTDITRLNGTYWSVSGYWRGRIQSTATGQQTIQDLINRTYHLSMTYDNPNSAWVAGFGRLYLPWAPSLETLDGGYFGRRLSKGTTLGIFGGSTPDPTSYSYNPDQEIGGAFINFDGGDYDRWKYTSTSGVGISALKFSINRPFVFFENGIFYKRYFSIYDSLQADSPKGNSAVPAPGPGLSRNFLTVRLQPHPRVELTFNENYFRDIPTFDIALVGTGLLDKYLFQGFSAGARVEVAKQIYVYTQLGMSNRTGDAKNSLNQSYGVTFNRLPWWGIRADAHYSMFSSSFGTGSYEALTLSRNLSDALRLEVLVGQQDFSSALTNTGRSRFLNANIESTLGAHYFIQGGLGFNRGDLSYDQWHLMLGYRFDSKQKEK